MEWLLAPGTDIPTLIILVLTAGFTSFFTASMGIGGGTLLMVVMASTVPLNALIPLHGLVQLGSNANRAVMTRAHIDWQLAGSFAAGAIPGAILASFIVVQLPLVAIQLSVACFILYMVWGKVPSVGVHTKAGQAAAGAFTTVVTMFVGATGPLVGGFIFSKGYDKLTQTATLATCLSIQHVLKGLVFTFAGFAFWQWLPMAAVMIASGAVGTWVGLRLLNRLPAKLFKNGFRLVITLMALRLLWDGINTLVSG